MKKWLVAIPVIIVLAAAGWLAKELYLPYRGYQGQMILTIPRGARAPEVADQLLRKGVIAHRLPFLLRYWLGRWHHETLKFGEYLFDRPLSISRVYWKLARGQVYLHTVVIPEGSDRFDMARILHDDLGFSPQAFLAATRNPAPIRNLDPQAITLEGYLFPDTYRFPRGVSASVVVRTMLERFRQVFSTDFRRKLQGESLHHVLTLASLVEKETPNPVERPRIAGVFTRRLEKGMLLECDPTVIYAVRLQDGATDPFNGPITRSDLEMPSPYNTYVHAGLPPGPICSPGVASIQAALHPAPGSALYFESNNHGGHYFADTLAEHRRNVERSRRELQEMQQKGSNQR
ncbi:MAG: endolytic transglycosylase MltG [Terriglobia bacterium]